MNNSGYTYQPEVAAKILPGGRPREAESDFSAGLRALASWTNCWLDGSSRWFRRPQAIAGWVAEAG
jgi:hypothetical protein